MDESVIVLLIGAVAYQLGSAVLVPCSRDRRFGLGPSGHIPGKHRRYTADDLVRLRRMLSFARGRSSGGPAARPAVSRSALRMPIHDGDGSGALAVERANRAVRGPARSATRLDGRTLWSRVGDTWRRVARDGPGTNCLEVESAKRRGVVACPAHVTKIDPARLAAECPHLVLAGPVWSAVRAARDYGRPGSSGRGDAGRLGHCRGSLIYRFPNEQLRAHCQRQLNH